MPTVVDIHNAYATIACLLNGQAHPFGPDHTAVSGIRIDRGGRFAFPYHLLGWRGVDLPFVEEIDIDAQHVRYAMCVVAAQVRVDEYVG